ncbi:MAG: ACT domain-containing protein [Thermoplasmata archaeon]|nr:ACT domain-containing protein [Thermoplasmata archaeon]
MVAAKSRSLSAADVTREYIDAHPSIREVLRTDLLNYTALARMVQAERELRNEEAVTIACRRYQRELARATPELEAIRAVLSASRIQVHTNIALVRVRDDSEALDRLLGLARKTLPTLTGRQVFEVFQGTRATTVLCDETLLATLLPEVPARLRVAVERDLAIISFRSRPDVSEIPGVVAYLAEALFLRGVNCLETVSVHTDSIFVFPQRDLIRAYQTLSALIPAEALPPSVRKRG